MKRRLVPATALAAVLILVLFVPVIAFSATPTPTSGALLTISNGSSVNLKIYDSQIHTGTVRTVPVGGDGSCSSLDQIPTDAYVLQGSAATGCDPGDSFETANGAGVTGTATLGNFTITSQYLCVSTTCGAPENTTICESEGNSGSICIGPEEGSVDTGFLTVKNNGADFNGTITLSGKSVVVGGFCPAGGAVSDSFTGLLAAGASRTFALSSDSSNCGGFNQGQTQTLVAGQTSIFAFGMDDYQITPLNSAVGDTMTITPIPVPAGYTTTPPSSFDPGTNFPGKRCVAYKDFSGPSNPVCVEIQRDCVGANSCGFLYTAQLDFNIDGGSLPNGIGGPTFMGKHAVNCPTNAFDLNIFFSYIGAPIDPVKGSGNGGGSCFVAAFDPNATPIATGNTFLSFVGFQSPVSNTDLNIIKAGSAVPLKWQQFISPGVGLTNLSWCPLGPSSGNPAVCQTAGVSAPWVFVATINMNCMADNSPNVENEVPAGGSGLQNFGDGSYQFNWKTVKGSTGCVDIVLLYDSGLTLFPAQFKYK